MVVEGVIGDEPAAGRVKRAEVERRIVSVSVMVVLFLWFSLAFGVWCLTT